MPIWARFCLHRGTLPPFGSRARSASIPLPFHSQFSMPRGRRYSSDSDDDIGDLFSRMTVSSSSRRVCHIPGTGVCDKPPSGSFINHIRKETGESHFDCAFRGCSEPARHGAHVTHLGSSSPKLMPTCQSHNPRSAEWCGYIKSDAPVVDAPPCRRRR